MRHTRHLQVRPWFGGTVPGGTQTVWALAMLGGYFFLLAPRLPEGVLFAIATAGAIALWAVGAGAMGLHHSRGWLAAGRSVGLEPASEQNRGFQRLLMPELRGIRDGRELIAETDFATGYQTPMRWTRVSATLRGHDAAGSIHVERRGLALRLRKRLAPASPRHSKNMAQGEAALAAFKARGGSDEDQRRVGEALDKAYHLARLQDMEAAATVALDDRDFDRRFETRAEPPEFAHRVLDPDTRNALLEVPWLNQLTVAGGLVQARVPGHVISPATMNAMVAAVLRVAEQVEAEQKEKQEVE